MADPQNKETNKIILSIKDMGKIYTSKKNQVKALEDINLDIYEGDIFGVIGLSGAGKSTLVRCMNFLERPTTGTVIFDGKDLASLTKKELLRARQSMGMIFQQFNLLMQRNAVDNVCFPLEIIGKTKKEARIRALELLELVGLSDKAEAYPTQLSGGQKQRVAIARALASNPRVLLCDEATSALDPATTHSILELLKQINRDFGLTIVVITHEMSVIEEICHRIAIIDNSHIAETGNVIDIFTNPKTQIAKEFVFPGGDKLDRVVGSRCCEIIFDGNSSYEPILAKTILECKAPVNIMFANTKNVDGKAFGQMIVQLPEDDILANKVMAYLRNQNIIVKEVEAGV
ncbi:MAG: ATP-binding cassette domain-containing protein [Eubacteriales bacterium]|nr:ATP-binding cassette domain-containing protein [Eubacteriales bacterium]MDD3350118.1 ATP-binding cassette domain-containing protein [Eubacteriales bacterium]